MQKLVPSMVVTFSALSGCSTQKPPEPETNATVDVGKPDPKPRPSATSEPASGNKRVVKNKEFPRIPLEERLDYAKATKLNPKDDEGRVIYAGQDGSCYVQVPLPKGTPPAPTGSRNVDNKTIDCPASMNDAAWDSCLGGTMLRASADLCACDPMWGNPPPPPSRAECPGQPGAAVSIHTRYRGRVLVGASLPGADRQAMKPLVIKSQKELDAFVASIPDKEITKKQPSPPSTDPLLAGIEIDFDQRMLLVAFRTSTMYVHPVFAVPRVAGQTLHARVVNPPLGDSAMAAARSDVGTYAAIVIDKHDGEVAFE